LVSNLIQLENLDEFETLNDKENLHGQTQVTKIKILFINYFYNKKRIINFIFLKRFLKLIFLFSLQKPLRKKLKKFKTPEIMKFILIL